MDILIIIVDIIFFLGAAYNVYWQSQIEIRSTYKISALIFAAFLGSWLLTSTANGLPYIVMVALFVMLTIMDGVGGVGTKKVVLNGFYSSLLDYSQIVHVTLIPIEVPDRKPKVAVIFNTTRLQQVELSFNSSYKDIENFLKSKLSSGVPVEIGQM